MRARSLLAAAAILAPWTAVAQPPPGDAGLVVALRGGYAVPYGDVTLDAPVDRIVTSRVPFGLELGYRFNRRFRGTLQLELSPASVASCARAVSCSASDVRVAVELAVHLAPGSWLDPWAAVGAGVEVMNARTRDTPQAEELERSWAGVELPLVEAGVDITVSRFFVVGPFVTFTASRFTSVSQRTVGAPATNESIDARATHGWLAAGLRAMLLL